jgi:hypothetical protein
MFDICTKQKLLMEKILTTNEIELINNTFTASEALDLVNALLEVKVNFHKLHRLSINEGNCNEDTSYDNIRIEALQKSQKEFKEFTKSALLNQEKISISGSLFLEILD